MDQHECKVQTERILKSGKRIQACITSPVLRCQSDIRKSAEVIHQVAHAIAPTGTIWLWGHTGIRQEHDLWALVDDLQKSVANAAISRVEDRAWIAAMIDCCGDITISMHKGIPRIELTIKGQEAIADNCRKVTNGGTVTDPVDCMMWHIAGLKAADVIAEAFPYIIAKRKEAVVAFNAQVVAETWPEHGETALAQTRERTAEAIDALRTLRINPAATIPTWMAQPKMVIDRGLFLKRDFVGQNAKTHLFMLSKSERPYVDDLDITSLDLMLNCADYHNDDDLERDVVERCILAGTRPGDIVADPFCADAGRLRKLVEHLGRTYVSCPGEGA